MSTRRLPESSAPSSSSFRASVDLLELQAARRVAAFDRREAFYELGEHSTIDWIRTHTHVSAASADSQVTLARQLESLEPTVEAVEQGDISFEHALAIARQLRDLPESAEMPAQAELLQAAAESIKEGVPLCRRKHHPQVTEGGYQLKARPSGAFELVVPTGVELHPDRWRRRLTRSGP
jgi:hypothetical protein